MSWVTEVQMIEFHSAEQQRLVSPESPSQWEHIHSFSIKNQQNISFWTNTLERNPVGTQCTWKRLGSFLKEKRKKKSPHLWFSRVHFLKMYCSIPKIMWQNNMEDTDRHTHTTTTTSTTLVRQKGTETQLHLLMLSFQHLHCQHYHDSSPAHRHSPSTQKSFIQFIEQMSEFPLPRGLDSYNDNLPRSL